MRSERTMRVIRHSILLVILGTIFMTSTYSFAESRFPVLALADANVINTSATVQANYSGIPRVIDVDVPPQTINGKTMLPARVLVENLGGQIQMSTDGKVLTIIYGGETKKVICDPKTNTFTYNGQPLSAVIKDNRTLMGLRDVCEKVLNVDKVDWYNPGKQAYVLDKGKVFVAKIDSKQITIMDEPNTYTAAQVKVAMYADSITKSIIYADLASSLGMGSANTIAFIDGRSGVAVQYIGSLKETYQDETGLLEQAAFTTRFNQLSQTNPELFNSSNTFFVDKEHFYVINPTTNTLNIDGTKNITLPTNLSIDVTTGIVTDSSNGAKLNADSGSWEVPAIVRTEAQKALINKAKPFIAAGEFIDTNTFPNFVETGKNGAIRVYSTSAPNATEKALFEKFEASGTTKAEFCCDGTNIIGINGNEQNARFNNQTIAYVKEWGMALNYKFDTTYKKLTNFTDSTGRVIQEYNKVTGKMDYLDPFRTLYTPEQYRQKTEQILASSTELKGQYSSIEWMKDAQGNPSFLVLIGDNRGITPTALPEYQKTVNRFNEIDPKFVKEMREVGGVQIVGKQWAEVARAMSAATIQRNIVSPQGSLSFIYINEDTLKRVGAYDITTIMPVLVAESNINVFDYIDPSGVYQRPNKMLNTNSIGLDKQARSIRQYEIWGGIDPSKLTQFSENRIDMFSYAYQIGTHNVDGSINMESYNKMYGVLTWQELGIGTQSFGIPGFNQYVSTLGK